MGIAALHSCLQTAFPWSRFRTGSDTAISQPRQTSMRISITTRRSPRLTQCWMAWDLQSSSRSPQKNGENSEKVRSEHHSGIKKKPATPHGYWLFDGGAGGIRTHGTLRFNWFRVSPVMTTSIPLRIFLTSAHLGKWRERMGRTSKIWNCETPKNPVISRLSEKRLTKNGFDFECGSLWPLRYASGKSTALLVYGKPGILSTVFADPNWWKIYYQS